MHPLSFICCGVFFLFFVPFAVVVLDKKRGRRERVLTGCFAALLLAGFLFVPGLSPIRGAIDAAQVDALCSRHAVGGTIDPDDFERQAKARGLRAVVNRKDGHAHAHALVILRVMRMCDIEYSQGRVTKISGGTHAP